MTPEDTPSNRNLGRSSESTSSSETDSQALRRRAEALAGDIARKLPESAEDLLPEAARQALHELRVHQIELEMQNEELRRIQEELELTRARYFDLYDLAPVGYFTLSEAGLILETNLTATKLLGVPRGDLVKQPLSSFILPEDQDIHYRRRKQLLETAAPQSWELRLLRKDVAPFWARVQATIARDTDGASVWRVVVSDITETKRTQEEKAALEAQNRQLQKAEGLGRMAGALAHKFNNLLTAVMGNLELAIGGLPKVGGPAGHLTNALRAAGDAAEISKLMLTCVGQTSAQPKPLDLSAACSRSLPLLRAAIPAGMVLDADLPSPGPAINADANQLQQALTNLVINAWEAGIDGRGVVRIAVKTVLPADIPASRRYPVDWMPREQAYACLEVADAGRGIPDEDLEKLFDPFFTSKSLGRGLGLPVVLGIVRTHAGAVTVETKPGRGSAFRIFLPLLVEKLQGPSSKEEQPVEADAGGTILLVEDEPDVRKLGGEVLMSLGFTVLLAKDGVEAVEVFRQHQDEVRCVLSDLTMPRMNGWETLAALRKLAPGLPVILASGYDEAHAMAGGHPERPQAFLSKPYRVQELRDAISRALAHGKKSTRS